MDIEQLYIVLLGIIALITLYSFFGALFQKIQFHYIHQTGVGILLGLIFGLIVFWSHNLSSFSFNQQIFFIGLLPPMIFAGGYNLKKTQTFKNLKYILIFGVIGTIISFFVIFSLTYLINKLQWIHLWNDSQAVILSTVFIIKFSATICATDSVAALTLIKPLQYPKLFSVIFGEGMINDAVAIILFKVVGNIFDNSAKQTYSSYQDDNPITFGVVLQIIWQFLYTVAISLAIGAGVALLCSFIFRKFRFLVLNSVCSVVVIYMFGILSYIIAQMANMSGVLTVLVCGVTLAHFNFYNLTLEGILSTGITFQSISFIAQAIVFIYLGLSTVYYVTQFQISPSFFAMQLVICVISRLTAIFGLSLIFKIFTKKKWNLSYYQLAVVSMAGTIRGSVAFALILTIEAHHEQDQKIVQMLKSTVLLMVFLTTIILGALMPTFVKFCLSRDKSGQLQISILEEQKKKRQKQQKPRSLMKVFDEDFLKTWMIYDYKNRKQEIKEMKMLLKMNSPSYKGGQYVAYAALIKANIRQTVIKEQLQGLKNKPESLLQSNYHAVTQSDDN